MFLPLKPLSISVGKKSPGDKEKEPHPKDKKTFESLKTFSENSFIRKRIWQTDTLHCNMYCFEPGQQNSLHRFFAVAIAVPVVGFSLESATHICMDL